ncbi:MAG: AmmeMemoRadiSam system protein B [Arcobacteraceae bacterium]|jgi:AmmeMemoRadiSam system protein B|nr:AmmeMemoRadiSam system protein B [Arcobacteraceae bacterium]MDX9795820.1 AmmeMemoRadiSam system protein B [Arcobacteraceae bacterium]
MKIRKNAVSGSFYPNNIKELHAFFEHVNAKAQAKKINIKEPKAIISPHAGYVYSGLTANEVYRCIENQKIKRFIVIGPSHRVFLQGASIALYDEYETPLGNLTMDLDYSHELKEHFDTLFFNPLAHSEHSTETQMPFIKNYFPHASVVEIVYGKIDYLTLCKIISYIMLESENFVVISTDLSHFYSQEDANYLDGIFLQAIQNLDLEQLDSGCEACGMIGVKAIAQYAVKNHLKSQIIDYRTSYDASGDDSRVVGYTSVLIGK